MSKKNKKAGICKLSLQHGLFVDSHLLPKALTRAEGLSDGLIQHGYGRTERRFSSWYDNALVTAEGEKILSDYDDFAIRTLRNHRMIWSGWGPAKLLLDVGSFAGTQLGIRNVDFADITTARRLRLFFLSILWRAAATTRPEFREVSLTAAELEQLRRMVIEQNPEPLGLFPISVTQLSTIGKLHNHTTLSMEKHVPAIGEYKEYTVPIFRFYFDGLIAHFSRSSIAENESRDLRRLHVGEDTNLAISTTTYEKSRQAAFLALLQAEASLGRPLNKKEIDRITRMF